MAGQLESRDDTFTTRSGRKVSLRIWTPAEDLPKTTHAMYSLKASMKWDEEVNISSLSNGFSFIILHENINENFLHFHFPVNQVFGLEYDLDLFNIVAVPDFNMLVLPIPYLRFISCLISFTLLRGSIRYY